MSVATFTASALDGNVVHYAKAGRIAGAVTLCNGRTMAYALTGAVEVNCRSCIAGNASGRIEVAPELEARLAERYPEADDIAFDIAAAAEIAAERQREAVR